MGVRPKRLAAGQHSQSSAVSPISRNRPGPCRYPLTWLKRARSGTGFRAVGAACGVLDDLELAAVEDLNVAQLDLAAAAGRR